MSTIAASKGNKNWLLVKFRQWHSWGGLFLSVFILLVAITGILLNHKDLFLRGNKGAMKEKATGLLTTSTEFESIPVTFASAMTIARNYFGEGPLEKIELKDERGWLVYKVVRGEGEEIVIDARTAEVRSKYGIKIGDGEVAPDGTLTASVAPTGMNWAKIVDDLHTGKIFGTGGKLLVDLTSLVIIALTLSGIYLWGVPYLRKRRSARERSNAPALTETPIRSVLSDAYRVPAKPRPPAELVESRS